MHEAYEVSRLLPLNDQIEAIAAYDGHLLLGTRLGHLLMYSLSTNNNVSQKYDVQIEYYCKTFSKKPIQQLEVIPEENLLLCLTDNILSAHDIKGPNFPLKSTFQKTKGASLFALDKKTLVESITLVRLCVAVRRRIQLYFGKNGEFKEHEMDFSVADVPKVMAWGQQYLWVGFKSEYTLFDFTSRKPRELFPTSSARSLEPTITRHSDTGFLLGRDKTSVLVEEIGESDIEITKIVKWNEAPVALVWDEPYVLGLQQDGVCVQALEPNVFIQTLPGLNKARIMYKCKSGLIFVASVGQVWCLSAVDIAKQRHQLLKDKHFQIAIDLTSLSDLSPDKKRQKIHSIQMLHALDLFDNKQYSQSMREFVKLNTDPAEVIKLFPELDNTPESDDKNVKLTGKDLENALNALIEYMTILKTNISKEEGDASRSSAPLLELIDTTLLKCYLQTNDASVAPLLRLNNCRFEEAERTLLKHGKHSELIILYQLKGHHTKALQLLREQALQTDSPLRGYQRTRNYLQHLGAEHLNLIFKFCAWILEKYPEEGLKIFTEDITEVKELPRASVLDFLLREHELLVIPYMEHVIHTWNDTNPSFHDALITKYREKITDKKANATEEELLHTKAKLVSFLEDSSHYTPERMVLHFPSDSLFEERAVILGKLGRHEQALGIYVQILGDVDKALKYCETVTSKKAENSQDVFVTLMRILLNPEQSSILTGPMANLPRHPKTMHPDLETSLSILEKHADKISPLKALAVLPDSVPLNRLKHFLISALDSQLTLKRRSQTLKGLLYAEHVQVQAQKHAIESMSVLINNYNVCPVCKKRFGNQSAFVRYPNGDIVHYSCRMDK